MSLLLSDIVLIEQIIRTCQQRGSFQAEEMVPVGNLYVKVKKLLEPPPQEPQETKMAKPKLEPIPE